MSKYIDAMAAADKIRELVAHFSSHSQMGTEFLSGAEAAAEALRYMPAADVAPVVRCKDCRWRGREDCAMFYRCECGEQHTWETDYDFCSYGEKL